MPLRRLGAFRARNGKLFVRCLAEMQLRKKVVEFNEAVQKGCSVPLALRPTVVTEACAINALQGAP